MGIGFPTVVVLMIKEFFPECSGARHSHRACVIPTGLIDAVFCRSLDGGSQDNARIDRSRQINRGPDGLVRNPGLEGLLHTSARTKLASAGQHDPQSDEVFFTIGEIVCIPGGSQSLGNFEF